MNRRLRALVLSALLVFCAAALNAQNVFVAPNPASFTSNISVVGVNSLTSLGTFTANVGVSFILSTIDGSKVYIISSTSSNTVQSVDTTFTTVRNIASLGGGFASAAIISPDGRRLILGGPTVQIFDTATDTQLTAGINVFGTVIDLAANLESTRVFALVNTGFGSQLVGIDLATNTVINNIFVPGLGTGVSAGPNGLLYVTTQNAILEIDPRTVALRQQITLNGRPAKMVFTPDGRLGVAANTTPITGTALFTFDLQARTLGASLATASIPPNVIIDKVIVVGINRVLAFSSNTQSAFDLSLTPLTVNAFAFSGAVSGVAATSDIATPLHSSTQYLFLQAGNTLSRFDLAANQLSGQVSVPVFGGTPTVAGAAATGNPATMLIFGDNQSVAIGTTSLPLVIRLTDAQGRPLARVPVTFSTTAVGATLTTTSAMTSADGFAVTSVTAPGTVGVFNVTAAAGNLTSNFTVSAGTSGGGVVGGLTITSGQGLLLPEQTTSAPMTVVMKDTSGNLVVGASVTFTLVQGFGTLVGGISTVTNSTVVTTDANGSASINFLGTGVATFPGFQSSTVTATTAAGASVTFFVTTVSAVLGFGPTVQIIKPVPGDQLSGQAGQTLKGAVQALVFAGSGQPIPNVSLFFVNPADPTLAPSAMCAGTFALTAANGIASCDVVLGGRLGIVQVQPNIGYFATALPITITIAPGPPGAVNILQGNNQTGKPGDRLPLALLVQVTDIFGNVLNNIPVTWKVVTAGSGTLSNIISPSDTLGRSSALLTLGNISGSFQVTATAAGVVQTFTFNVQIPAAGLQLVSGNGQNTVVNTNFTAPLTVRVVDAQGNGFAGAQVSFAVTSGSANIVGSPTPSTDAQGNASVTVAAGANAGTITVVATFGGFSVTFTLTSRLPGPANITFFNGASFAQNVLSPGSIVTIRGNGMLPGVQGLYTAFSIIGPLPTTFPVPQNSGSVLFNNIAAPVFYVSNINGVETVTVQLPFEIQPGTVTVTINAVGGGSTTVTIQVQALAPGVFETFYGAQKVAVALRPDGSEVSPTNPARRGEIIRIYCTGLGQVNPGTATGNDGVPGQAVIAQVVAGLNNGGVPVISVEYAPGMVGVYVLTIRVPTDATQGPAQPIGLIAYDAANNQYTAQATFLPIQ